MEQLIEITTVPIKYQLKVQNASLNYKSSLAEVEITRDKGEMKIRSKPIKLRMDTFDARNSVVPTTKTSIAQAAQKGTRVAYEATADFAREGQLMLKGKIGEDNEVLNQILAERVARPTGDFQLGFVPTTGPNIQWEAPEFNIEYEMDKLNFSARIGKGDFEFIPGSIELQIEQMPDIRIEYVGKPLYVPPSAAEHFEGKQLDVQA